MTVDISAGEQARWGHGILPPVPGDAVIRSGVAAIANGDPGFRVSTLTDWAVAATALNCQSLVTGDATCTRTFMANGLYRAHRALLELRTRSDVSCAGAWRAVGAAVVGATRSQLVEEVRVRVHCQGWRMERHQPTGLTLRGRRQSRRHTAPAAAVAADPSLSAVLAQARHADPYFDEQLLLDASQLICLVMFAAMSTGDEEAIRHLTAPSFWSTFFGRHVQNTARTARLQRIQQQGRSAGSRRQARLPMDYQALAPELINLDLRQQRACIRVSFSQLHAVIAPGAQGQTAMASATSLSSLAMSFGGAMSQQMNNSVAGLSWLSWAGKYDLVFTRPPGVLTDPRAAIANRTCSSCGATYRSELAVTCAHCGTERPVAWNAWRLSDIAAVE